MRKLTSIDRFLSGGDQVLRTLSGNSQAAARPSPAIQLEKSDLNEMERKHIAALMRINHTGEVCAQALYQGQAFAAKGEAVKENMQQAALEEIDHLAWCEDKLKEFDDHVSYLNPVWYFLSYGLGIFAGIAGDKWSLGFVEETEVQVCKHLDKHLDQIPLKDVSTRAVVLQMREDEAQHAIKAKSAGAAELPQSAKRSMALVAKLMTKSTYYI